MPLSFFPNLEKKDVDLPKISLHDKVSSLESMLLGVLAENNFSLSVALTVVEISKVMALSWLRMAQMTASYKMRLGIAKTFLEETGANLTLCFISLNIDESSSSNRMRVLCILASFFFFFKQIWL